MQPGSLLDTVSTCRLLLTCVRLYADQHQAKVHGNSILLSLQLPKEIVTKITGQLPLLDQASFRRVCTKWRDLHSAGNFTHRVSFTTKTGWQDLAGELRRLCPQITIVVQLESLTGLAEVLKCPHYDIISCYPQGSAIMSRWTLQTGTHIHDKYLRAQKEAEDLLCAFEQLQTQPGHQGRLELNLRVRSSHMTRSPLSDMMKQLKPAITQIREQESALMTANLMSPMSSLRTIAFGVPRTRSQKNLQDAIRCAPSLECIQVYAHTQVTAERLVSFLEVLSDLPKVTTLRVATASCPICLPSVYLQHITSLELGVNVSFKLPPQRLGSLLLEGLQLDYKGYDAMFSGLQSSHNVLCIELNSFAPTALQLLPTKLHHLKLLQALDEPGTLLGSSSNLFALHTYLPRLSCLKILCIADFLTARVMGLLSCLSFPQLHTLEMSFKADHRDDCHVVDRYSSTILLKTTTPVDLRSMPRVFPKLEHLRLCCFDNEPSDIGLLKLDCWWISKSLFPSSWL